MLKMLARDTAYIRASALTLSPATYLAMMSARCSAVVFEGRPSILPSLFALANPACVRSTSKSRSISATAANMVIIILPAGEVRSSLPSCSTMTAILRAASSLTVAPTSWASRPRRSSFATTSVSPLRICASSAANSGRSLALVLPVMVSAPHRIKKSPVFEPGFFYSRTAFISSAISSVIPTPVSLPAKNSLVQI